MWLKKDPGGSPRDGVWSGIFSQRTKVSCQHAIINRSPRSKYYSGFRTNCKLRLRCSSSSMYAFLRSRGRSSLSSSNFFCFLKLHPREFHIFALQLCASLVSFPQHRNRNRQITINIRDAVHMRCSLAKVRRIFFLSDVRIDIPMLPLHRTIAKNSSKHHLLRLALAHNKSHLSPLLHDVDSRLAHRA